MVKRTLKPRRAVPKLTAVLDAWSRSISLHRLRRPATDAAIRAAVDEIGRPLPAELLALYEISDGAEWLGGSLMMNPLRSRDPIVSLVGGSAALRGAHWCVPDELVVFGGNGADSLLGVWAPRSHKPRPGGVVVEVGEIFGTPRALAVVGTTFWRFLRWWTAYQLPAGEASSGSLAALAVPVHLCREPDARRLAAMTSWADRGLPDPAPDPYARGFTADELRALFGRDE